MPLRLLMFVSMVLMTASACTERAMHSFTFTSTAVPTGDLTLRNIRGGLRLRAAPTGTPVTGLVRIEAAGFKTQAEATAAAQAVTIAESGDAGALQLATRVPAGMSRSAFTVVLDLTVPEGVVVDVETAEGRVELERLSVLNAATTLGDLVLTQTGGDAVLRTTGGGAIRVVSHGGAIDARAVDGPISLEGVSGSARALTTGAPITALLSPVERDDEIFLSTTRAMIDLVVDRRFGARLLATTTTPGLVHIDHPDFRPSATSSWQAEGVIGTGDGVIDLRTTESDIVVEAR